MPRNPNWTRDELILALDLYFKFNGQMPSSKTHPDIVELSDFLNLLPIHQLDFKDQKFRNPDGIYMKLCNFLRFDPNYSGKGLDAGSKLDEIIWDEFATDRQLLSNIVKAIRNNYSGFKSHEDTANQESVISDDEEFPEGKLLTRLHIARERNAKLSETKKQQVLKVNGELKCEVCNFDFKKQYGIIGDNFAECHHLIPVSELTREKPTRLSDLAIVCANCHRMLHRNKNLLTISELSKRIAVRF